MKKFLFVLLIMFIGSIGSFTKALDFTELFNNNGQPLLDSSYQKLLNDCDKTRGYDFDDPVRAVVFSSTDKDGFVFSKSVYDATLDDVQIYRLFMSPYPIEYIKNGGAVDESKFIVKEPRFKDSSEYDLEFYISSGDVDLDTTYYGFIVPIDLYDEVGMPAAEVVFNINKGIAQYNQVENLCQPSLNKKTITLKPGLNTFSTPAIIKSVSFDNLGENLWFAKMKNGAWTGLEIGTKAFFELIQPLEGYLIKNMGTEDVLMTIEYDTDNSNSLMLSKNLDAGWNFLGITTTDNPFDSIANAVATMKKDLTDGGISNLIQLGKTFINATKYVFGKAYAVFVTSSDGIYGGVNNYGDEGDEVDCDDPVVQLACNTELDECPAECRNTQSYSQEVMDAYNWAYSNGIVFESNIDDAGIYNALPNSSMRAILLNFANYLGLNPDLIAISFGDLFADEGSYANRANFSTALSRILRKTQFDGGNPYYEYHLNALKAAGIMTQIDNPKERIEIRGYVLLMLMRASELYTPDRVKCDDPIIQLACAMESDECPAACGNNEGKFSIQSVSSKNTVLLKAINTDLATFTINPSNNGVMLEDIVLTGMIADDTLTSEDIKVMVEGAEYDASDTTEQGIRYEINQVLLPAGSRVEVFLKDKHTGDVTLKVAQVNGIPQDRLFRKSYADALVYIDSQRNEGDYTQFRLAVEKYDDAYEVTGVVLGSGSLNASNSCAPAWTLDGLDLNNIANGDDFTIDNTNTTQTIRCIEYYVDGVKYAYDNSDFPDYFKVDGSAWRVFSLGVK